MVGGLMLFHGIYKLQHGIGFIERLLHVHGAPAWLAYGVYVGEIIAPILLIIGFYSRIWAGVIAVNMLVALVSLYPEYFIHINHINTFQQRDSAFERCNRLLVRMPYGNGIPVLLRKGNRFFQLSVNSRNRLNIVEENIACHIGISMSMGYFPDFRSGRRTTVNKNEILFSHRLVEPVHRCFIGGKNRTGVVVDKVLNFALPDSIGRCII